MTNFATKNLKLPIEEIVMITVPRENFITAAIIGGALGIVAGMLHLACKRSCWEASNAGYVAKIDELQDQCGSLENDLEVMNHTVEDKDKDIVRLNHELTTAHQQNAALENNLDDKDKDIVRLNHELTTAHQQIATFEKKMTELKESYSTCLHVLRTL
jgi:chromosome segregation ATPase